MQWMDYAHGKLNSLEHLRNVGLAEDAWDRLVYDQMRSERPTGVIDESQSRSREPSWAEAPGQVRTQIYALIRQKGAKSGEMGTQMWEIVKQEHRLKNWEDLPFNVAKAIRKIRQVEVQLYKFTARHDTKYRFPLRPHNESITDQVEVKQLGRFDIPVEYVTRKGDTSPQYLGKRQSRDKVNRPEPDAQDGTTGVAFKPFGQR
jgi:hypothetical protein